MQDARTWQMCERHPKAELDCGAHLFVDSRRIMVNDKGAARTSDAKPHSIEPQDRVRMTARALDEIRQTGSAAALTRCRGLANGVAPV
jgi:hypothetical protein